MMCSTRTARQPQPTIGMAQSIAVCAYVVIVHLLLIHTLHLIIVPEAAASHHQAADSFTTHDSVVVTDPSSEEANCSAPNFVIQRIDIPLADVTTGTVAAKAFDAPPPPPLLMSAGVLSRPPGPERQAILQRFTL